MDFNMQPSCSYMNRPVAKPFHVRKVESATSLQCLNATNYAALSDTSEEEEIEEEKPNLDGSDEGATEPNDCDLSHLFDFKNVEPERMWLTKILQEDDEEEHNPSKSYHLMLKEHYWRKKIRVSPEKAASRMYYGSGLISKVDRYPDVKKARKSVPKKKKEEPPKSIYRPPQMAHESPANRKFKSPYSVPLFRKMTKPDKSSYPATIVRPNQTHPMRPIYPVNPIHPMHPNHPGAPAHPPVRGNFNAPATVVSGSAKKKRKFRDDEAKKKWEDVMGTKRRKLFTNIVKKEINRQHRAKMNKHKEMILQCRRAALQCQKFVRQKALQSARIVKEQQWRMKRLARENLAYWKRSKRVDREIRRKMEKEAEEQRKIDFEFVEAKRQQRKLNFLITQTELYAHFMSRKLGKGSPEEQLRILSQLDEEKIPRLASIDDYDSQLMKAKAMKNAEDAFQSERARTSYFDSRANSSIEEHRPTTVEYEHPQPAIFKGVLKGYQLRGMNWLANLYDQGISGILADEMGLGKTVQSIAFLCHVAERYSVWGPFLVISPASTLHNWQQELEKFVPVFKVVPYWGNPNERKILRQFWDQKDMHTRNASFHIVVTSYQIVITDIKYFNRIKWQYMILDEAQAIKSTSSMRWKMLLGFSCRNRLLLSGTPIQNSMAELWALLHFIMPTLFDSHEEFNEWFSKDIESHAENKTGIDEKHLSRLHMILKPFMLRRIKRDVENELSDKIEVMVFCPLTTRQKLLYFALKKKIQIEDLLHYTVGGGDSHTVDKNFTSNLMNLVMQFRKVCNHPELFERRDAKSPIYLAPCVYQIPYLIYDYNVRQMRQSIINKYFRFTTEYIYTHSNTNLFNFMSMMNLSPQELYLILDGCILTRWKHFYDLERHACKLHYDNYWSNTRQQRLDLWLKPYQTLCPDSVSTSSIWKELLFTWSCTGRNAIYTHTQHRLYFMQETLEHRNVRLKSNTEDCDTLIDVVNDDVKVKICNYETKPPQILDLQPTTFPTFLFAAIPKLETCNTVLNCYSRRVAWDWQRHVDDYSWNSLNYHWTNSTGNEIFDVGSYFTRSPNTCIDIVRPMHGWSHIIIPDKETLVTDSGKLSVLDGLLKRLKAEGHRVLIYSQMTKMIDLLEEYMWHRHHKYMRLDGSSKISDRRDMVADFQARNDIFVFLLSTRAGGLGINLTAADTVIFYDSDWNPTVDQQAMDRAHRLGQTKQVTVYRLICKGSIEERILQRAREKSEIQKLVISGGNFKPDTLKPKEVVSLLLDDEEIELKYRQRTEERKQIDDIRESEKKRKTVTVKVEKKIKEEPIEETNVVVDSGQSSPRSEHSTGLTVAEDGESGFLDDSDGSLTSKYTVYNLYGSTVKPRAVGRGSTKRGRPRGSRRVSALGRFNAAPATANSQPSTSSSSHQETADPQMPSTSGKYNHQKVKAAVAATATATATVTSATSSASTVAAPSATPHAASPSTHAAAHSSSSSRRGPGRPRLKPGGGPTNAGSRGSYRPRKPARPLPVPLPPDTGLLAPLNTDYASYLYDFPDPFNDT